MGKDIRINEDDFFIFLKMVKEYISNCEDNDEKEDILNFINYHIELRNIMNEKDLWFEFFKKNNSVEAIEKYKELKEKHKKHKEGDMWKFNG